MTSTTDSEVQPPARPIKLITGPEWFGKCKKMNVLDSYINYYDPDENTSKEVVMFLHGNATSSYLWRNIIPYMEPRYRCIAPDYVGMGESGKSGNLSYRVKDHYKYISAWLALLNLPGKVVFVTHDWGSCLAFHHCFLNQGLARAHVHCESVVDVIVQWDEWPDIDRDMALVKSKAGEEMVMKDNFFVGIMLPKKIMRQLEPEEFEAYLKPFKEPGECRRPTLSWPREIPMVNGGPPDVLKLVRDYNKYLRTTVDLPKMFLECDPGFFSKPLREGALEFPNTIVVKVKGLHFPQEDSPHESGEAIKAFIENLDELA